LEKTGFDVESIIITVKDIDVSLEICRLVRTVFNQKMLIIVVLFNAEEKYKFSEFDNINIITPTEIVSTSIISLLEKGYKIATNIGLGKGDIIEVKISAKSNLVDRKLKYIISTKWKVAAIYRDNKIILPSDDERLKIGDIVILVGEPKILENISNILLKGVPQFPLQFGTDILIPFNERFMYVIDEISYIIRYIKTNKVVIFPYESDENEVLNLIKDKFENFEIKSNLIRLSDILFSNENVAFYVFPFNGLSFFERLKLKTIFENANKPFLVSKGNNSYSYIAVLMNSPNPAYTLEIGMEISRLFNLEIIPFYVALPKSLRKEADEKELGEVTKVIKDFEKIYKKSMNFSILEGNSVKETLKYMENFPSSLLIMSYKNKKISLLEPLEHYLIAKKHKYSSLVIPVIGD